MRYSPLNSSPRSPASPSSTSPWRPWPLRTPFLAFFCFLCIFFIIATQLIIHGCSGGCHIFGGSSSATELSTATYFVYNLLPAIVTLVFGLVWAVVHHDIMRMEPYFQMSAPGGVLAADSLFLEYSYMLPIWVPFEALRCRHYVVFMSSCITILAAMLVTPLASGIFDDTAIEITSVGSAIRPRLHPLEWRSRNIGTSFSHLSYNYAWLGGSLPPFVKPEYALLPVQNSTPIRNDGEIWVAETTMFEADMVCEDLAVESGGQETYTAWSTVRNWTMTTMAVTDNNMNSSWRSIALRMSENSTYEVESQTYLYIWASINTLSNTPEISACLCNTSYYSEPVLATFEMPSGNITHIARVGPRIEFDAGEQFRYAIDGRYAFMQPPESYYDSTGALAGLGYTPNSLAKNDLQLVRRFGRGTDDNIGEGCHGHGAATCPSMSMVSMDSVEALPGLALYREKNETLPQLLDTQRLVSMYKRALQLEFALAVSLEMVDTDTPEEIPVTRTTKVRGFAVNLPWARGVQGGLSVMLILAVAMAVANSRRACELDGEPNSMAAALRILWASPELSADMEGAEFYTLGELKRRLGGAIESGRGEVRRRYKLRLIDGEGPRVSVHGGSEQMDTISPVSMERKLSIGTAWQLRGLSGGVLLVSFGIVLGLLVLAFEYSQRQNGLTVDADVTSFKYKVLYSYIPIALSTAIEPVLVTLGSFHCMLTPYKALIRGHTPSSSSIGVDYDKSPPHFQLLRALRGRNIGLAFLTMTIFLSNVLAVAFAGLFSPIRLNIDIAIEVESATSPMVVAPFTQPAYEMYYTLTDSLSHRLATQDWTTPEYYVLPFYPPVGLDDFEELKGPTIGIGADISCSLVPTNDIIVQCIGSWCKDRKPGTARSHLNLTIDDPCWNHPRIDWRSAAGNYTVEYPLIDRTADFFARSFDCADTFFLLWAEIPANPTPILADNTTAYLDRLDTVALKCTATEKVTEITATVDGMGQVLSIVPNRNLSASEVDKLYRSTNISERLLPTFLDTIYDGIMTYDYRGEHLIFWFDYAMGLTNPSIIQNKTNITFIPNEPILGETFERVFRQLFAINLHLYANDTVSMGDLYWVPATAVVPRNAVGVNRAMFITAVAILIYTMVMLVILYWVEAPRIPGHLPYSLAGMYSLLYASNAKEQCGRVMGKGPQERAVRLAELGGFYSIGRFIDKSMKERVGVYREVVEYSLAQDGGNGEGASDTALVQRVAGYE